MSNTQSVQQLLLFFRQGAKNPLPLDGREADLSQCQHHLIECHVLIQPFFTHALMEPGHQDQGDEPDKDFVLHPIIALNTEPA
jgi:hypothetical protein